MFEDLNPPDPILDRNDPRLRNHKGPSIATKAVNATRAASKVVKAAVRGEAVFVDGAELKRRDKICNECSYWKPGGNLGMGECSHEKCGCTKLKRGLATETCPLNKW